MTRIKIYYTDRPPEEISYLEVDSLRVYGIADIDHVILKYATSSEWSSEDPVLLAGEMGIESDTRKFKFGDGVTTWNSLAYYPTGTVTTMGGIGGAFTTK